ncbi:hypothetical protein AAMO2058_001187100 [Amorphochlora amoebiformis]
MLRARALYPFSPLVRDVGRLVGVQRRWFAMQPREDLRNVAIIAHVDHGKTSLVDCLLKQSETGLEDLDMGSRVMDSDKLEQERGITILSKCASVQIPDGKGGKCRINLVDTPGHADFGGEVERIINMVDGVCLVVDATEGPMSQTKFVVMKALNQGLKPIVLINKCDRESARLGEVESEVFDMLANVGADDDQLDFPIVYASAKEGWATEDPEGTRDAKDMSVLFDRILQHVPPPMVDESSGFSMLVTQTQPNQFLGKEVIGRIHSGVVKREDIMKFITPELKSSEPAPITKISQWFGIQQVEMESAKSGDIVSIAGFPACHVNDTVTHVENNSVIKSVPIDPPVLSIAISSNSASPLSGLDGDKCTFPMILERIESEIETNVSLTITKNQGSERVIVHGRGELQLGILLEQMRREGFELACSSPEPVLKHEGDEIFEPMEELTIECANEHTGMVIEKLAKRKADMAEFDQGEKRSKLVFKIPFRSLLGYRAEFTQDTRGDGIIHSMFDGFIPYKGHIQRNDKGAIISTESGKATGFALGSLEARGKLFIEPGDLVYPDMVIGESSREQDLEVNPCKEKELTNVRAAGKDERVKLSPATKMSIEQCITYARENEVIEITPKRVGLRKIHNSAERKKLARNKKNANARKRG